MTMAVAWRIGTLARQPAGLPSGGVVDRIRGVFDRSVGQQQLIITRKTLVRSQGWSDKNWSNRDASEICIDCYGICFDAWV